MMQSNPMMVPAPLVFDTSTTFADVTHVTGIEGEAYVLLHVEGEMVLPGMHMDGKFDLVATDTEVLITMAADFHADAGTTPIFEFNARGVLQINGDGIAGKVHLVRDQSKAAPLENLGLTGIEFESDAIFDLLVNTTGKEIDILLPTGFDALAFFEVDAADQSTLTAVDASGETAFVVLPDERTGLRATYDDTLSHTDYHLRIPEDADTTAMAVSDTTADGEFYLLVRAVGNLLMPGMALNGSFELRASASDAVLTVLADLIIGYDVPDSNPVETIQFLKLKGGGAFHLSIDGIAGKLQADLEGGVPPPLQELGNAAGMNIQMDAEGDLIVNTTEQDVTFELPDSFDAIGLFDIDADDEAILRGVTGSDVETILLDDELTSLSARVEADPDDSDGVVFSLTVPNTRFGSEAVGATYIIVRARGTIESPGFILTGSFDIDASDTFAIMAVNGLLEMTAEDGSVNPAADVSLMTLRAQGLFKINGDGIAGKLGLRYDANDPDSFAEYLTGLQLDANLDADFDLVLNTTEQEAVIEVPDGFDPIIAFEIEQEDADALAAVTGAADVAVPLRDELTTLTSSQSTHIVDPNPITYTLTVPNTRLGSQAQGEVYMIIRGVGVMTYPGFELTGNLRFLQRRRFRRGRSRCSS